MRSIREIRLDFKSKLSVFLDRTEISTLMEAFDYANKTHRSEVRDDDSRYIEHPVAVVFILAIECGILILDFLLVALFHDVPESKNENDSFSAELSLFYIATNFGLINSHRVRMITKSKLPFIKDKHVQILLYYGDMVSIFVKLADTLHNIRTLKKTKKEKKIRKAMFVRYELPALKKRLLERIIAEVPKKDRDIFFTAAEWLTAEIIKSIRPYNKLIDGQ